MDKLFMTNSCQWIQGVSLKLYEELPHWVFVKFSVPTISILCQFFSPDLIRSLSILLSQHYRFLSTLLSQPYRFFCPNFIDFSVPPLSIFLIIDSSVPALSTLLFQLYRFFYRLCPSFIDFFLTTLLSQSYRLFCPNIIDSSVPALSVFYRLFCPSLIDSSVQTLSIFYRLFCPSLIESSVPTCPQNECFCRFKWRSCKNRRSEWKLGR